MVVRLAAVRSSARRACCARATSRGRRVGWSPSAIGRPIGEVVGEGWRRRAAWASSRPDAGLLHGIERQLAVRAEDSDDDDDPDRTYAFPPPVDLDAYAAACRLPPAEETEDEREARFQRERYYGL